MNFKDIRRTFGNQKEFGTLLGVKQAAVSKWELGKSYPRRNVLKKLKELTGLEVGEIYQAIDNSKQV